MIRAFGKSEKAAVYAGISPVKVIMISMLMSGGLAGMMAINNVMGEAERLVLNSVEGAGFIGIAVALMGRSIRSVSCLRHFFSDSSIRVARNLASGPQSPAN
jgi:ABC-type uncharacterized transport system permease subunit